MATNAEEKTQRRERGSARPRVPARERGIQRFALLLDATDALLNEKHADDVGLYQIAERANVPPASVYHFFPTKDAAFLALTRRYLEGFEKIFLEPIEAAALTNWLTLLDRDRQRSVAYFNEHPAAMKLLLGRYGGQEARQADLEFNKQGGAGLYARLKATFVMPKVEGARDKFRIVLEIQDAIWAISFAEHGHITSAYEEEASRACRAYLRLYFPEYVALREEHRETVAKGLPIKLGE
jgi:AcrR family transcriptional regulator